MKARLPWWGKVAAKLVLSRLPVRYVVWQKLGLFRHGSMDRSGYSMAVFDGHVRKAGLHGQLRGRTILELGPGDSIATAILAAAHGARAILVDAGSYVRQDLAPYHDLIRTAADTGLDVPGLSECRSVTDILQVCGARYLTNGLASFAEIQDESIDLIFSQAVLEHVRLHDFASLTRECRRVLKAGGVASHRVDLQDHLDRSLNNLRFSESVWESDFFTRSGFYTNRIRYTQMLKVFQEAGFVVKVIDVRTWNEIPTPRRALAPAFRDLPEDELRIRGFDVLLTASA